MKLRDLPSVDELLRDERLEPGALTDLLDSRGGTHAEPSATRRS